MILNHEYTMRRLAHAVRALGAVDLWDVAVKRWLDSESTVPAFWWALGNTNFGDMLAPVVLGWISGARPLWVSRGYEGKVLSVGTVLGSLSRNDIVWGSGTAGGVEMTVPDGARVLAVRGPLTRATMRGDIPEVYGDPACLLPRFHHDAVQKRWQLGLVPHHADAHELRPSTDPQVTIVDVLRPWKEVVDAIRACETVASSSLHGLIVADAYGVPSRWIASPKVIGGPFKFHDYFLGTDREPPAPARWGDPLQTMESGMTVSVEQGADRLLRAWREPSST